VHNEALLNLNKLLGCVTGVLLLSGCGASTVRHVLVADLPLATGTVVYALPKTVVQVKGALTHREVSAPKCDDEALALSLGLERERGRAGWALDDVSVDTFAVTDFSQLYAVDDGATLLASRKLSLTLNEALALSRARTESTSAVTELARGIVKLGTDVAATALALAAPTGGKVKGTALEQARPTLCASAAQSLVQLRTARVDLLSGKGGTDVAAADDRLAALERSVSRLFTGEVRVSRVPFECRVDAGVVTFADAVAEVPLLAIDAVNGKLLKRGAYCLGAADAWGEAAEGTTLALRINAAFVSSPAQRRAPTTTGLAYRIPSQAELTVLYANDPRARASRPLAQVGIVASLPESSLSGSIDVDLDPATGALRRFDSVRASTLADVANVSTTFGEAAAGAAAGAAGKGGGKGKGAGAGTDKSAETEGAE
jgi:hypothetical protein